MPGIVGWAGVKGRNANTWEKKFELDLWYVDNRSFWLDLKIFVMAIWIVLKREGVSFGDGATMPRFTGGDRESETGAMP